MGSGIPDNWPAWAKASLVNTEAYDFNDPFTIVDLKFQNVTGYDPVASRAKGYTVVVDKEADKAERAKYDMQSTTRLMSYKTTPPADLVTRSNNPPPPVIHPPPDPLWDRGGGTQPSPNDSYMAYASTMGSMAGLAGTIIITILSMLSKKRR